MLKLNNIKTNYGLIEALKGVSMEIKQGEITAVIGANGAGKSTVLNTISGVLHPASGTIEFDGERIGHIPPHRIVEMGISQVPEGRRIFPKMVERIFQYFPIMKERLKQLGGTLSGGEQQMLAIARALMSKPKLILLDEPSLGLAPIMTAKIFEIIKKVNEEGVTVILVEQNANAALKLAHNGYVMETGKITMRGKAKALLFNPHVKEAYLGG
ncbi:MAG: ABC transporter ATP-binding protein [Deltaproteobacteria bacterium]|nr:ABC transporter ATP-binding protein [Deltaproteobacteria bacterium]